MTGAAAPAFSKEDPELYIERLLAAARGGRTVPLVVEPSERLTNTSYDIRSVWFFP
jgi:hypothetical protein